MLEVDKSFRRLKARKQLPILRAALLRHQQALLGNQPIASKIWPHSIQLMAPAAPISTGTGTIRSDLPRRAHSRIVSAFEAP
jgi:hypothetical protein